MLKETLIAVSGIGVGFMLAKAMLQKQYDERLDEEIARTREFFAEGEVKVEEAIAAMTEYQGAGAECEIPEPEKVVVQEERSPETRPPAPMVPENTGPVAYNRMSEPERRMEDIVQNAPASPMDPNARAPYLITFAEFDAGPEEVEYDQMTVSFFAADGMVLDEEDTPLSPDRVEQVIGTDNLNRFGTQTDDPNMDPNVIYVRCERFNMDFEVTRSPGSSAEILGQAG